MDHIDFLFSPVLTNVLHMLFKNVQAHIPLFFLIIFDNTKPCDLC